MKHYTDEQIAKHYADRSPDYKYHKIYAVVAAARQMYTYEQLINQLDKRYPVPHTASDQ